MYCIISDGNEVIVVKGVQGGSLKREKNINIILIRMCVYNNGDI